MNIIKESRAYFILGYLYFFNQMGYEQFKHIFGEETFECTKDAMQKLVRAGYVEKIQKHGINSFSLTQNGYKICLRYFKPIDFHKPVRNGNTLDRVNRVNYEELLYYHLIYKLKNETTLNDVYAMCFAPNEKEELASREPLAVQQVQGNTLSFVLITRDKDKKWKMFCFFFLYDHSKVFNETTEKNMMLHLRKKYENFLKENGFEVPTIDRKAVFITDSYGLIAEIVKKSLQTKKQRNKQQEEYGYIRTRGAIVESTFGFSSFDLHFLVNDGDYLRLIGRIVQLLNYDSALSFQLDQKYYGCCKLTERSFMQYAQAYELLVSYNVRSRSFMDRRIYIENDQIPYITYIRDRYMPKERVEKLNSYPVFGVDDNPIILS